MSWLIAPLSSFPLSLLQVFTFMLPEQRVKCKTAPALQSDYDFVSQLVG